MSLAIGVIIVGLVIVFFGYAFAFVNIGRQAIRVFDDKETDPFTGFGGTFKRHIVATISMMLGIVITTVGIVLLVVQLVQGQ